MKIKEFPKSTVDLKKYREEMLTAMVSGNTDQQQAITERMDKDSEDSARTNPQYQILRDITEAMGKEIQADQ
jgi:hypothetical protein